MERAKILNEHSEFSILGEGVNRGLNVGRLRSWIGSTVILNLFQNLILGRIENKPSPQPSLIGVGVSVQAQSEVLHDNETNHPLPQSRPQGREKHSSRFTHHFSLKEKAAFTLAEDAAHVAIPKNQCKAAFTLAEVLITLGIIGVVAALTMPSLIANYQKTQFETGVKKMASVVGQAVTKLMADEGVNTVNDTSLLYEQNDKLGGEFLDN